MIKINGIDFMVELGDILAELQSELKINGSHYLHTIRRTTGNYMVTCPYHKGGEESKPSCGIKESDGTVHCFTCQETHTLPEMISFVFGHNDHNGAYGWGWLLKNFLSVEVENRATINFDFSRGSKKFVKDIEYVSEDELDKYRYYHPYWTKRGVTDDYIIELFDLGYDKSTRCITMPIRDINGNTLFVARRSVDKKWFNYPKGAEKPLYGLYELSIDNRVKSSGTHTIGYPVSYPKDIFVCESMIDGILLWQSGYYAVALNGLGDELQFRQLNEMPCREFILCTDNDDAGFSARDRIKSKVHNKIFSEISFPRNIKDVGECTREQVDNILKWRKYI